MHPIGHNNIQVTSPKSTAAETFDLKMELASKESNIATKREHYNNIFKTLRKEIQENPHQSSEYFPILIKLFEAFATSTCYNQTINNDRAEGFRQSAKLMEYSLCLQLKHLNLLPTDIPDWTVFESFDELFHNLSTETQDQGAYFTTFNTLNLDKEVLHQEAHGKGIADLVKDSLIRLAFSYQNMGTLNCPSENNIALHKKIDELTERLLVMKSEYAYNRRPFILGLEKPNDIEAKINAYQELLPLFKAELSDFDYKRKQAQIYNILGITLAGNVLRSINNYFMAAFVHTSLQGNSQLQNTMKTAQEYFIEGEKIHIELLNQASLEELPTQKFLTANVKSSLVVSLIVSDKLEEAKVHVDFLKTYIDELAKNNNTQTYQDGYKKAIALYEEALSSKL